MWGRWKEILSLEIKEPTSRSHASWVIDSDLRRRWVAQPKRSPHSKGPKISRCWAVVGPTFVEASVEFEPKEEDSMTLDLLICGRVKGTKHWSASGRCMNLNNINLHQQLRLWEAYRTRCTTSKFNSEREAWPDSFDWFRIYGFLVELVCFTS